MNSGKKILAGVGAAVVVGGVAGLLTPSASLPPRRAVVAWTLEATPLSNFLVSFLESRTNLRAGQWSERTNFPYRAGSNGVSVAMDQPQELFRAGWRFAR